MDPLKYGNASWGSLKDGLHLKRIIAPQRKLMTMKAINKLLGDGMFGLHGLKL
jgi:hypothetical protein